MTQVVQEQNCELRHENTPDGPSAIWPRSGLVEKMEFRTYFHETHSCYNSYMFKVKISFDNYKQCQEKRLNLARVRMFVKTP